MQCCCVFCINVSIAIEYAKSRTTRGHEAHEELIAVVRQCLHVLNLSSYLGDEIMPMYVPHNFASSFALILVYFSINSL